MKLIKGKGQKNIAMAEIFNGKIGDEKGDLFIDYGKGVMATKNMLYMEDLFSFVDRADNIEQFLDEVRNHLQLEIEDRDTAYRLFIDGDFTLEEAKLLKSLEIENKVELTVSVQTDNDGISILDI